LRAPVLAVVGRHADEATWTKLHDLGLKTTSIEEKQNYYDALVCVADPKLAERTLKIATTDELPSSRASFLVAKVARDGGHADRAWQFAKANMKQLLAKTDALGALSYAPGLFTFFSDAARIDELNAYAKASLGPEAKKEVEKATDEISFRVEFKQRLSEQVATWITAQPRG
jgi:aminopeptidase N